MSDDPVIVELEGKPQVAVQLRSSIDTLRPPTGQIRFRVSGVARLILTGRLRELRAWCREAVELTDKLETHFNLRERYSMRVVNFTDGTMEITARIQAPPDCVPDFFVEGPEAVKRYRKWIVLVAAGMLAESAPGVIDTAMRYVASLGPDSDD